jgi:hypothetical protein
MWLIPLQMTPLLFPIVPQFLADLDWDKPHELTSEAAPFNVEFNPHALFIKDGVIPDPNCFIILSLPILPIALDFSIPCHALVN